MSRSTRYYPHTHIILVPGFGAFDALGRVEYYSGITRLFFEWRRHNRVPVTLHYFDNLPSAAVATRATLLRMYLAKRIVRGEIQEDDRIVLVGHSTGGLDIRQLIWDLHDRENKRFPVDSGHMAASQRIRECLEGVVFLSVPHWGTNIADWVHSHGALRAAIIAELRAAVEGSQVYLVDAIETQIASGAAALTDAGMLLALKDALTEANARYGRPSPLRTAEALEAASELALYFRQMWSDFDAIHDLACQPHHPHRKSPAQFDEKERERERELWLRPRIWTLSYATVGGRAVSFKSGEPAPVLELTSPGSYIDLAKDFWLSGKNDFSYRLCYRACAGGPFRRPPRPRETPTRVLGEVPPQPLELWDNDGIVNTASMFWPTGDIVLVAGDHLDIVGHYQLRKAHHAKRPSAAYGVAREYRAYDCLQSWPRFTDEMFREVWTGIFDFATHATARTDRKEAAAGKGVAAKPRKLAAAA